MGVRGQHPLLTHPSDLKACRSTVGLWSQLKFCFSLWSWLRFHFSEQDLLSVGSELGSYLFFNFKKIYLFDCVRSYLQHIGSLLYHVGAFVVALWHGDSVVAASFS